MAAADNLPMPSTEFLAPSRQDGEADMDDIVQLTRSIRLRSHGEASAAAAAGAADATTAVKAASPPPSRPKRKPPQGWEYEASIDATLQATERHPAERPSPDYLRDTQAGQEGITAASRAELVDAMTDFSRHYRLAAGTPHRAAAFVDRFLSARKLGAIAAGGDKLGILGGAAVLAAAKYEDRLLLHLIGARQAAELGECSRREVLAAERQLVAALGYRLGGPTAYTFVDHFTRHIVEGEEDEEAAAVWLLAHHLADMALLSYQCVAFLPSVVAASAVLLAGLVVGYPEMAAPVAGYTMEELSECVDAIYDVHASEPPPGFGRMMARWEATHGRYSLPPQSTLADLYC
ncbi:unnamed protein product [Urochloa decumbens]|uniref:Cyclin N-terminal domain-containing protein n=1 Tax=Urochloa decumbens TaxID=240449 RepID=A0ABC9EJ63_9POAL